MVFKCGEKYDNTNRNTNNIESILKNYPFELDHFQKFAIEGIEKEKHVLITAHTGSGKTLPAEYAIQKFHKEGKKVIYTSPIKSLSNQKYYEFTKRFPNISFGVMTGDIKFNPEADCIIMTTEILKNALYSSNLSKEERNQMAFNIDIKDEVACVIFDEVHYINDQDRGKVWEESIMRMPDNIQMLMLSATIDKEEHFAQWIEDIKKREVWIASTNKRVVPLKHYMYYTLNSRFDKKISSMTKSNTSIDLTTIKKIQHTHTNELLELMNTDKKEFIKDNYSQLYSLDYFVNKNNLRPDKKDVIQKITHKLKANDMLPAICFIFSRKQVEQYASYIEHILFSEDEREKTTNVDKECKKILMKFPNYKEYIELPEYDRIISLMRKGVSIHHSGLLPVFREMIEIMFSEGYVKLLFATETFAVGINMPTKTVLFTNLMKYSNNGFRYVYSHEYTQMAGRAGRRGLDKIGHVIHLSNLFEIPDIHTYNSIMSGKPQTLKSKFEIVPQMVLKMIDDNTTNDYIKTSMNEKQTEELCKVLINEKEDLERETEVIRKSLFQNPKDVVTIIDYLEKTQQLSLLKPKKRKALERELTQIKNTAPRNFSNQIEQYKQYDNNIALIDDKNAVIDALKMASSAEFEKMYNILLDNDFIEENEGNERIKKLTDLGVIACNINEVNNLVISNIIISPEFSDLDVKGFITFLSMFIHVRVTDEYKRETYDYDILKNEDIYILLEWARDNINNYEELMLKNDLNYNKEDYELCYNIYDLVDKWCDADNEEEAKHILNICVGRGLFIGEFIKCLLKIVNISNELNSVAKKIANVELEHLTSNVEEKILKFVATNQSLYI